jgi:hypothetical protein
VPGDGIDLARLAEAFENLRSQGHAQRNAQCLFVAY